MDTCDYKIKGRNIKTCFNSRDGIFYLSCDGSLNMDEIKKFESKYLCNLWLIMPVICKNGAINLVFKIRKD